MNKQLQMDIGNENYNIEVQTSWYSVKDCLLNQTKLYIFGDNILRIGKAGQAQIRDLQNTSGIATKFHPGMDNEDFFSDTQYEKCCNFINEDINKIKLRQSKGNYQTIVFPVDGLGTGLSQLAIRAPKVSKYLSERLLMEFGIKTTQEGKLYV